MTVFLKRKRGFIFDLDGTLVDSQLDYGAMRRDLGFSPAAPILEAIAAHPDKTHRRKLEEIVHRHELAGADCATPIRGSVELLSILEREKIKVAIFTRNSRVVAERTLARVGFRIPLVISRDDAPAKPDPTGLQIILSKWRVDPDDVIFVGDYLYDLEAGQRAGIPTLLFSPETPDFEHDTSKTITTLMSLVKYISMPE